MDEQTPRLRLPLLQAGQAQKEATHNEALALIDLGLQAVAEAIGRNDPPAEATEGSCWVVGQAPVGAWTGHAGALAGWSDGGWRFVPAFEGAAVWDKASGLIARFAGGAWTLGTVAAARIEIGGEQVVGARQPSIAAPNGGAAPDLEARGAIVRILDALRSHGLIAG